MSPIYVFFCDSCKKDQEELFALKDRPESVACNQCGSNAKLAISSSHFIVNGANAANGYRGDSNYRWLGSGDKKK